MSKYRKGRTFEYRVMNHFRKQGFRCFRLAGSKPFDFIAFYVFSGGPGTVEMPRVIYAVECKAHVLSENECVKIRDNLLQHIEGTPMLPLVVSKTKNGELSFFY